MRFRQTICDCPTCGCTVQMIWAIEMGHWTGRCYICGTIVNATKEEVVHV